MNISHVVSYCARCNILVEPAKQCCPSCGKGADNRIPFCTNPNCRVPVFCQLLDGRYCGVECGHAVEFRPCEAFQHSPGFAPPAVITTEES